MQFTAALASILNLAVLAAAAPALTADPVEGSVVEYGRDSCAVASQHTWAINQSKVGECQTFTNEVRSVDFNFEENQCTLDLYSDRTCGTKFITLSSQKNNCFGNGVDVFNSFKVNCGSA